MKVTFNDDAIIWSDFAYENNYNKDMTDYLSYKSVGPFEFSGADYFRVISEAAKFKL